MHVTLVFDRSYGAQALEQAERGALWLVRSPQNSAVIRELWARGPSPLPNSPTLFNEVHGELTQEDVAHMIVTVDEHHPGWQTFEVIGYQPTPFLLDTLQELAGSEGSVVSEDAAGFVFARVKAPADPPAVVL